MARRFLWLLALALTAGCAREPAAPPAEEARPPVEVRTAVDRAVATTGDVITYRVTVEHDPSYEIEAPEAGAEIAGLRIIDVRAEGPRRRGKRIVVERIYELRADLVGSYVLPPLTVSYRPAGADPGAEAETAEAAEIFVEVESVLPAEGGAEDIRDIKPLRRIRPALPWLRILAALLGAAALLATGLLYLRYRRRPRPVPAEPPHLAAFRALEDLRRLDLEDPLQLRRFYFGISEAIRSYVEGRFGLNATDLTSEEILARIGKVEELDELRRQTLGRFLLHTDSVKFAEHEPSPAEIEETWEGALGFVETTGPVEEIEERKAA